jgi:hypothetical protein
MLRPGLPFMATTFAQPLQDRHRDHHGDVGQARRRVYTIGHRPLDSSIVPSFAVALFLADACREQSARERGTWNA